MIINVIMFVATRINELFGEIISTFRVDMVHPNLTKVIFSELVVSTFQQISPELTWFCSICHIILVQIPIHLNNTLR
jgi:hypothetical protein